MNMTSHREKEVNEESVVEKYIDQMAQNHAIEIDKNFWLVVKEKPNWMPMFIYKAVIKELVEFVKVN